MFAAQGPQGVASTERALNMSTTTTTAQTMTIGQGRTIHAAYVVDGKLCGSLCNAFAWESSRVTFSDQPASCAKCAKAVNRAAELVARDERTEQATELACLVGPGECPDPETGMPCNACWTNETHTATVEQFTGPTADGQLRHVGTCTCGWVSYPQGAADLAALATVVHLQREARTMPVEPAKPYTVDQLLVVTRCHGADVATYLADTYPASIPMVAKGWTTDSALNHLQGMCDHAVCTGTHGGAA